MKRPTLAALALCLCLGVPALARADVAVEPPTPANAPAEPAEESAPWWVWLLPPAGLILGLGLGARFRAAGQKGAAPPASRR